jgi:glycosyltransferase involved in cell wall biosynthesis
MRIAIISLPYLPVPPLKYGGTERVIHHLINGLVELGHDVTLYGTADSKVNCKLVSICDSSIPYLKDKEKDRLELEPLRQQALKTAADELRKNLDQYDIIHSHGMDLIEFQDFPNLTTLHGPIDFQNMDYFEERKGLYYASISKNQQETLPDLQYVGVVYNGLDPLPFPIKHNSDDYLCFLGRYDRMKQPHLAIQLALKLGMKIKLAGKIDYEGVDYYEEECKPFEGHPLVEFIGEVDLEGKIELLSNAKCNLHPTGFREPFGLSVLEAAYCGTPTLAISRGSMPELIEEGRTGLLVEDFISGYHSISQCFEMDREYIAQRARLLFNYKNMSKQCILAYEKVIEAFDNKSTPDAQRQVVEGLKTQLQDFWSSLTSN